VRVRARFRFRARARVKVKGIVKGLGFRAQSFRVQDLGYRV